MGAIHARPMLSIREILMKRLSASCLPLLFFPLWCSGILAETPENVSQSSSTETLGLFLPSLADVFTSDGSGPFSAASAALVVRSDGLLLTGYRSVAGAKQIRVRFSNGEVYDRVELMAFDERRDVAVVRIPAVGLRVPTPVTVTELKRDDPVGVICYSQAHGWLLTKGTFVRTRMADEVPGAGSGYRVVSFSALITPDCIGGVLVDSRGRALGLLLHGQETALAVPLESVLGLANAGGGTVLGSASSTSIPASTAQPARIERNTGTEKGASPSSDPIEILRGFGTYYVKSNTIYMNSDVLLASFREKPEFAAWKLRSVDDAGSADLTIEITVPFLSWEWNYRMVHRATGLVLASGKVKALEQHQAAPLLAADIAKAIESARGVPEMPRNAASPASRLAGSKKWRVKGGAALENHDLTLAIGEDAIFFDESPGKHVEIPTRSILSVYHFVTENREQQRRLQDWEHGWDKACEWTGNGEGCIALYGAPIWLLGEGILRIKGPASHFIALRWQDDQSIIEVSMQVAALEWKEILERLLAVTRKNQGADPLEVLADAGQLRQEFEKAKQKSMKIFLESVVHIGRWPPLGPGDFRMVVLARNDDRAEVFFFDVADTKLEKLRAVAAAHLEKAPREVGTISATLRDKSDLKLLDEIRFEDVILRFD